MVRQIRSSIAQNHKTNNIITNFTKYLVETIENGSDKILLRIVPTLRLRFRGTHSQQFGIAPLYADEMHL
jgi:hypothetical protein